MKSAAPSSYPIGNCEEYGVEDPPGSRHWATVSTSRMSRSRGMDPPRHWHQPADFRAFFKRHGVIFCPENQDVMLFPEEIGGEFTALHRPVCATPFTRPEMWIASSSDLLRWGRRPGEVPGGDWQSGRVGGGAAAARVSRGSWSMYHGNRLPAGRAMSGILAEASCSDPDDPSRVIRHLAAPCLTPELDFEVQGFVPNVIFPTGIGGDGPACWSLRPRTRPRRWPSSPSEYWCDSMTDVEELTAESPVARRARRI